MSDRNEKMQSAIRYGLPRKTSSLIVALCSWPFGALAASICYAYMGWFFEKTTSVFPQVIACIAGLFAGMTLWLVAIVIGGKCSSDRWRWIGINFVLSICFGVGGFFLLVHHKFCNSYHTGFIVGMIITAVTWSISTILLTRPTRKKRIMELAETGRDTDFTCVVLCDKCRADMAGLHDLVCTSCGRQYRLDELIACNARRVSGGSEESKLSMETGDEA